MSTFAVNFFNNTHTPAVGSSLNTPTNNGATYLSNQGTCGQVGYNLLFTAGGSIDYNTLNFPEDCFVIASSSYDILVRASFNEVSHINQDRIYAILDLENSSFRGDSAISIGIHSSPSGIANLVVQCMGSRGGNSIVAILHGTTRIFPGVPHDFKVEFRGGNVTLKIDNTIEPCYFRALSDPASSNVYGTVQDIGYFSYGPLGYLNHLTLGGVPGNLYPFYGCINKLEISKDIPVIESSYTVQNSSSVRDTVTSVPDRALKILDLTTTTKDIQLVGYGVTIKLIGIPVLDPITGITAPPVTITTTPNTPPPTTIVPVSLVDKGPILLHLVGSSDEDISPYHLSKSYLTTSGGYPIGLGYDLSKKFPLSINVGFTLYPSTPDDFSITHLRVYLKDIDGDNPFVRDYQIRISRLSSPVDPERSRVVHFGGYSSLDIPFDGYHTLSVVIEQKPTSEFHSAQSGDLLVNSPLGTVESVYLDGVYLYGQEIALAHDSYYTYDYRFSHFTDTKNSHSNGSYVIFGDDIANSTTGNLNRVSVDSLLVVRSDLPVTSLTSDLGFRSTVEIGDSFGSKMVDGYEVLLVESACNYDSHFSWINGPDFFSTSDPYFDCSKDYILEGTVSFNGVDNTSGVAVIMHFYTELGISFDPSLYLISLGANDNNLFFVFPNGGVNPICTAYINHISDGEHTISIRKVGSTVRLIVDGVSGTTDPYIEPDIGSRGKCYSVTRYRRLQSYSAYPFIGCIKTFKIKIPYEGPLIVTPPTAYCTLLQNFPDYINTPVTLPQDIKVSDLFLDESFGPATLFESGTTRIADHSSTDSWLDNTAGSGYTMIKTSPFVRIDPSADTNDFSIQLYVKLLSGASCDLIEIHNTRYSSENIRLSIIDNLIFVRFGGNQMYAHVALPIGEWTHVCFSCYSKTVGSEMSTWNVFIDGKLLDRRDYTSQYYAEPLNFFKVSVGSNFPALISHVMISTSNCNIDNDPNRSRGPLIGIIPIDSFKVNIPIGDVPSQINEILSENVTGKGVFLSKVNSDLTEEIEDSVLSTSTLSLLNNLTVIRINEGVTVGNTDYQYERLNDSAGMLGLEGLTGSVYTSSIVEKPRMKLDTIFKDKDGEWIEFDDSPEISDSQINSLSIDRVVQGSIGLLHSSVITDSKLVTYTSTVSEQVKVKGVFSNEAFGSSFISIRDYLFALSSSKSSNKKVRSAIDIFYARDLAISGIGDVIPYDPRFSDVLLLMHMDSNESELFLDSSFGKNVSNGDATISDLSTSFKFGDGSYSANLVHGITMLNGTVPNDMLESFTISAQIFPIVLYGGEQVIISKGDSINTIGTYFKLSIGDGEVNFISGRGVDEVYLYASIGSYNINEWSHIAVTFDADTGRYRLLVNGVSQDSMIAAPMEASDPLDPRAYKIGMDFNNTYPFQGLIDEVMVVKRNLYPGTSYLPPTARYPGPTGTQGDFLEENINIFTALASSYEVSNEVLEAVYLLLEFLDLIPQNAEENIFEYLQSLGDGTFEGVEFIFENVNPQEVIDSLFDALEYILEASDNTDDISTTTSFGELIDDSGLLKHGIPDSVYRDNLVNDALKILDLIRLGTAIQHKERLYTTDTLNKFTTFEDLLKEYLKGSVAGESMLLDPATNRLAYKFIGDEVYYRELITSLAGISLSIIGNSKDDYTFLELFGIVGTTSNQSIVNNKASDKIVADFIASKGYDTNMSIFEVISALDLIYSIFSTIVNESLTAADTTTYLSNIIDKLHDYVNSNDSLSSSGELSSIVINIVNIFTSINIGYYRDLNDVLESLDTFISTFTVDEYVTEQYLLAELLSLVLMDMISEKAEVSVEMSQFAERSAKLNSLVIASGNLAVTFLESLNDNTLSSDSMVSFTRAISSLSEIISSSFDILINSALYDTSKESMLIDHEVYCNFAKDLIETFNTLESILCSFSFEATEAISLVDTLDRFGRIVETALEAISVTYDTTSESVGVFVISESTSLESNYTNSLDVNNILSSPFVVRLTRPTSNLTDTYLAYVLSPEQKSVTTYSNYSFDDCTKFGSKYLFCNSKGLYEYGGTSDDGDKIRSTIKTFAYDFKSSNLKQVPSVYLGITSSGSYVLRVSADGKGEAFYKLNKKTQGLNTQKVDIGKGIIGRYFQFELISDDTFFNIDQVEFYSLELKRKL